MFGQESGSRERWGKLANLLLGRQLEGDQGRILVDIACKLNYLICLSIVT